MRGANLVELASSPHLFVLEKHADFRYECRKRQKHRTSSNAQDKSGPGGD